VGSLSQPSGIAQIVFNRPKKDKSGGAKAQMAGLIRPPHILKSKSFYRIASMAIFPSIPPHCNISAALQQRSAAKSVDKVFALR